MSFVSYQLVFTRAFRRNGQCSAFGSIIQGSTLLLVMTMVFILIACGSQNTPMDADTRMRIDSIANAQIAQAQVLHDSLCKAAERTHLPYLVDSIKKIRLREIEEQLKTVPK
jgi:hypothetical protein